MATDIAPAPAATEPEVLLPISYKAPILMGVLGLLAFVLFGLRGDSGETTTFDFSLGDEAVAVPDLVVNSKTFSLLMALICLALAGLALMWARQRRKVPAWAIALYGVAFMMSFLSWVVAGKTTR
jgi:general nucleoside transport system permease protein